ncbi:MAG: ABC transporter ATP-binding protein [Rhodospirillaceae bacterium]|nr:ABC transporter ATP-binding protein [Rhodospirillaceae bacterium]
MSREALLEVNGLSHSFGGLTAVAELDFTATRGQIKGIIGPNGAGKTTLFNLIAGILPAKVGTIRFKGEIVNRMPAHKRVDSGMARTFQNLQLFAGMSVLENVMIGCHARTRASFLEAVLRSPASVRETRSVRDRAMAALAEFGLERLAKRQATDISFGEGKVVEIARALAAEPELVMLDEPTAGLPHGDIQEVATVIRKLNDDGITVLLVEHNMRLVMSLCDDILVLNYGRRIAEGRPEVVRKDPEVLSAYLGEDA